MLIRQKLEGGKRGSFVAGALLMLLAFCWLTPCSGMEVLTQAELDKLSGKDGISIGVIGGVTVKATFNSLCQGDPDGWGAAATRDQNQGWLALIGDGQNTGTLGFAIPANQRLTIDVGTTTADCVPKTSCPGFTIPSGESYFNFMISAVNIILDDPATVNIALTDDPFDDDNAGTAISTEMDMAGWIAEKGVSINLNPAGPDPNYYNPNLLPKGYIWAH